MAKVKISNRSVADAEPSERDVFLWDSELTGFGLKITPAGKKVYLAQYRAPADGRWRRFTIGAHGAPWTPEKARGEAKRILGEVAAGRDPGEEKQAARRDLTVAELCELYLSEGISTKKESTIATDRGRIARHVIPLLGKKKVSAVTRADVERFRDDVAAGKSAADVKTGFRGRAIVEGGKGTATRTVGLLGGVFSFAVARGLRSDNPVTGVRRFADKKNERYLSGAELARLGEALNDAEAEGENPNAIAALRLLLFTGCRKNEVLELTWGEVDFERSLLRLADSKTGAKIVPLGAPALELLASLPRQEGSPYVFPAASGESNYQGLPKAWERIRARATLAMWKASTDTPVGRLIVDVEAELDRAPTFEEVQDRAKSKNIALPTGLTDVRIHDLRHSFASVGASAGDSLPIIGKLLGHRHATTTARYAHLSDDPLRAAADRISGTIAATMRGSRPAEVVSITTRRKPA